MPSTKVGSDGSRSQRSLFEGPEAKELPEPIAALLRIDRSQTSDADPRDLEWQLRGGSSKALARRILPPRTKDHLSVDSIQNLLVAVPWDHHF